MTAVLVAALLGGAGHAQAAGCAYPATFPGENAASAAIAAWMAARAAERGLPGELPVMAALARSGLSNLPVNRAGRAGYFGMLERLWGDGPGDPPLQLDGSSISSSRYAIAPSSSPAALEGNAQPHAVRSARVGHPAANPVMIPMFLADVDHLVARLLLRGRAARPGTYPAGAGISAPP